MLPDFLIIGAEKAGTTWLHDVMRGHPGLYLPDTKELHFFNRTDSNGRVTDRYARHGLAWYEARFDGARPGQMVGEATPLYLSDSAAPDRIRATLPEARFIIVLRDPVARSWSHYRMAVAKGHVVDPLDTLIDRRDETVLGRSLYAAQLDRWFSRFPRDRFLILFFEDVMSRKPQALARIAAWLGVDPGPFRAAAPERPRNPAAGYRSAALYNASVRGARALRDFPPTRGLACGMKSLGLYDLVKRANRAPPPPLRMTAAQHAALMEVFRPDVARLSDVHDLHPPWPQFRAPPPPTAPPAPAPARADPA